jgi:Fur family ferric uptake transcriptional regulator
MGTRRVRRSVRRDQILHVLTQQDGHVSADELSEQVRVLYPGTGRATVYRALQRLVESGAARKVDFGEGRLRYEAAQGRPHHFHLVCSVCQRTSEFVSSDVEAATAEVVAVRRFEPTQTILQIHGTCEECRTGKPAPALAGPSTTALFARDALRMAINTERSGREFYARAVKLSRDKAGRRVFAKLAFDERQHLARLEARYRELVAKDPRLETLPPYLFFKGAANGVFAEATGRLRNGVNAEEALKIGISCERRSHRFFQRYGSQFEESEGKRIFLEFAGEERDHLQLLMRELRALRARRAAPSTRRGRA